MSSRAKLPASHSQEGETSLSQLMPIPHNEFVSFFPCPGSVTPGTHLGA